MLSEIDPSCARVSARCEIDRRSFPVALSDITCEGCSAEADIDWSSGLDFLHLKIANRIDVNGRVLGQNGSKVTIGFFGQIHPRVVREL